MIRIDKEKDIIEIKGNKTHILSEFAELVRTLYEAGINKKQLELNFKMGFMNNDELYNLSKELVQNFGTEKVDSIIEKVLKEGK